MSMVKLKLVGCDRYNFKSELYVKTGEDGRGKVYMVGESKAAIMLRKKDEFGRHYFAQYVKPAKSQKQLVAERAAKIALAAAEEAAAEEENIVERPDGSEPTDPDEVVEVDPEAAVEVDTDDLLALRATVDPVTCKPSVFDNDQTLNLCFTIGALGRDVLLLGLHGSSYLISSSRSSITNSTQLTFSSWSRDLSNASNLPEEFAACRVLAQ